MILDDILFFTKQDLAAAKEEIPLAKLKEMIRSQGPVRDFKKALQGPGIKIISEIKKASPSAGIIRDEVEPAELAGIYETAGASAISVVTERHFFKGSLKFLEQARQAVSLPVLRKDFVIDEYQVYEARAHGADAVLLITGIVKPKVLSDLIGLVKRLKMTPLVEVHDNKELNKALAAGASVIGINNRDLTTMTIDLDTTFKLVEKIPKYRLIISESGVHTRQDMVKLKKSRVKAVLIGEALMRSTDVGRKMRELLGSTTTKGE